MMRTVGCNGHGGDVCPGRGVCLPGGEVCPRGTVCLRARAQRQTPPLNRITDRCKNITFNTFALLLRTVIREIFKSFSGTKVTLISSTGFQNGANGRISDDRKFHGTREKELPASVVSRLWIWIHIQGIISPQNS